MHTSISFLSGHRHTSTASTKAGDTSIRPLITARELQVLYLIAYEHSTKDVAAKLFISMETVSSHRKNIMTKLNVKNTAGMVRVAFELGLLTR